VVALLAGVAVTVLSLTVEARLPPGGLMNDCLAVILGGGRGTRLFPLTHERSKPAVPIAGKYRLIDIPISNCLNSDLRRIFVLTQYNSESLNKHISLTYKFDVFTDAFVSILAAEQTEESADWFQGTADAVRQTRRHLAGHRSSEVLILSGDQLFQMDFRTLQETHRKSGADATLGVIPVARENTSAFGILKMDDTGRITHFEEKPGADRLDALESEIPGRGRGFLASMGIYMFKREALESALADASLVDFGRHVIPKAIDSSRVQAHVFEGYWEDVGTIASYFEANLELTKPIPSFDFYDALRPVYTRPRFLPATKVEGCTLREAVVSEGCILMGAEIERSIIGIRSRIGKGTRLRDTLVLGADDYETVAEIERALQRGLPPLGIGEDTVIQRAIIDKNARIGRGVRIVNEARVQQADGEGYFIRDGIVLVTKGGVIRDGTVI
jgi:glucose-1-phosphate adenylyltransferase